MKNLHTILLLLSLNLSAFGFEFVASHNKIKELRSTLLTKDIYQKRKLFGYKKIPFQNLGRKVSGYLFKDNNYFVFFKDYMGNCKIVKIQDVESYVYDHKCIDWKKNLVLHEDPSFKFINSKDIEQKIEFQLTQDFEEVSILGLFEKFAQYEDLEKSRWADFKFYLSLKRTVKIEKYLFLLDSEFSFHFDQFSFLPKRVQTQKYSITHDSYYQDMLFKNDLGQFIMYKNFQEKPFTMTYTDVSINYLNYLTQIDNFLYPINDQKYCFMDNYLAPTEYDCHKRATNSDNYVSHKAYSYILIDPVKESIDFIK